MPNKPTRIVILGAGFGGVYAFKQLHKFFHNDPNVCLILVNSKNYFLFTPLLHEVATGGVSRENVVEPLRKVMGCCLAEFYLADVLKIELGNHRVITTKGVCSYDYLIVALGAETNFYDTPGAKEHAFTLKSLESAVRLKNHFIKKFEEAATVADAERLNSLLSFVVVGGGPTGVELAAEMAELFYETFGRYYRNSVAYSRVKIILLQSASELLPYFPKKFRKKSLEVLKSKKIEVRFGVRVKSMDAVSVELASGERIFTETAVWVAGVKPRDITFDQDVEKSNGGRIVVNAFLQMKFRPEVFILGDMAKFITPDGKELPMLAQVASKEGVSVAKNISNMLSGKALTPFFYHHSGDLISLGQWMAAAEIRSFFFWGHFTWWFWRTIYLYKLISFQKKIKVAVDWTLHLFSPRDISQL